MDSARRWCFDRDAEAYARWRPGYPDRLYAILERICGLGPGSAVLEIGPGTGQATRELLARGARLVTVELGGNMAQRLRAEFPDLTVINADFTTASLPDASFDLAVCATSMHWLDAATAVPKIARALRPGGWLAAWWTVFGDPSRPSTPFRERLLPMLDERLPGPPESHLVPRALRTDARVAELTSGGWFTHVETDQLPWSPRFTPAELTGLFATFPNIAEHPSRDDLLADIEALATEHARDGKVTEHYLIALYLAQRPHPDSPPPTPARPGYPG
ncbi:MAG TPA: methyltransferase domain-containing protein [Streptosporangiaceae bacterium]|nr:methyltransferase domain-containing protein [Streptosporangiaceae bacterium]